MPRLLFSFDSDLKVLQQIPILDVLWELQKQSMNDGEGGGDQKDAEENKSTCSGTSITNLNAEITLFEWISANDDRSTLEQIYEECKKGIEEVRLS